MKIEGKVVYQELSGGFWGITDEKGNNWKPINMPESLQKVGLKVKCEVKESTDAAISIFMWGTSVELLKFEVV